MRTIKNVNEFSVKPVKAFGATRRAIKNETRRTIAQAHLDMRQEEEENELFLREAEEAFWEMQKASYRSMKTRQAAKVEHHRPRLRGYLVFSTAA